jgi:hypothetical protein
METELVGQLADFFLVVVDQIAARFRVHAAETVAQSPYTTAHAVARLHHHHTTAAPLEFARSRESRESGTDD